MDRSLVVSGSSTCFILSFTLFCSFSMSVSSFAEALFTLSQVTRGFIVIPCNRKRFKQNFAKWSGSVFCVSKLQKNKWAKILFEVANEKYLKNDSEVYYDESSAHHQILLLYLVPIQHRSQAVCNSPSQATVAHNHLIYELQGDQPELVQDPGEEKDTCSDQAHKHSQFCDRWDQILHCLQQETKSYRWFYTQRWRGAWGGWNPCSTPRLTYRWPRCRGTQRRWFLIRWLKPSWHIWL